VSTRISGNTTKRTLKQYKRCREDLIKQGYLSVFEFIEHMKETAKKKTHVEKLVERAIEIRQESEKSEESALKELGTKDLVSKHVGQVCHQKVLTHLNLMDKSSLQLDKRKNETGLPLEARDLLVFELRCSVVSRTMLFLLCPL